MTMLGSFALFFALVATVASAVCCLMSQLVHAKNPSFSSSMAFSGRMSAWIAALALTASCALLIYCFLTGNTELDYVVNNLSDSTSPLAPLYRVAGLWAGREGSLLFWAWLISVFGVLVARRAGKSASAAEGESTRETEADGVSGAYESAGHGSDENAAHNAAEAAGHFATGTTEQLHNVALLVMNVVLAAFVGMLVFSADNAPFKAIDPSYLDSDGNLIGAATMWGMNSLLEHWAMAIHPPMLFIGYAGFTVPFAYAVAAAVTNDAQLTWVKCSRSYAIASWLFLSIGIGLGSVWAYAVLGWGGYWGWDPVENASLLPWLMGLALIHTFTANLQRGMYKRWALFSAAFTFAFVIYGTFISRSGLVSSVHSFSGDAVSTALLAVLMIAALICGIVMVLARRKSFAAASGAQTEAMMSKDISYYVNNLLMTVVAVLLGYLTISSALPSVLPFGGTTITAGTYNAIARPLGILYCLLMAVCPFLGWKKTSKEAFAKQIKVPALVAIAVFCALLVTFFVVLYPNYVDALAAGGTAAAEYTDYGPGWYYHALAIVGLAVASLLCCNAFALLIRRGLKNGGGALTHFAMAVILVGLIGSSMYTNETTTSLHYDEDSQTVTDELVLRDYSLTYTGKDSQIEDNGDVRYVLYFDVYKNGEKVAEAAPEMQVLYTTKQQKLEAAILKLPTEDLFVVFQGVSADNTLVMNVRINPLINFVWVGFALLCAGMVLSFVQGVRRCDSL